VKNQAGFTLVELMISLALGLVISASVIQVMISNNATERLNRGLASVQENGRFIVSRLRNELLMAGRYDMLSPALNQDIDLVSEAYFVTNSPVPALGDFAGNAAIGAIEGVDGASDTLVVAMQGTQDCRGVTHGYADDQEFFVVNQYFLDANSLKCRGFDGRVLQGQKVAVDNDADRAYTLLDDVYSFQVQYGISADFSSSDNSARPVQFITADALDAAKASGAQVVAIRIALLLKADADIEIAQSTGFKLLDEAVFTPSESRLFKQFEVTVTLRNSKNTVRSRNL
jgi:type IV pilus assembly protein PilW